MYYNVGGGAIYVNCKYIRNLELGLDSSRSKFNGSPTIRVDNKYNTCISIPLNPEDASWTV